MYVNLHICKDARQWRVRFLTSKTNLACQNRKKVIYNDLLPDKIKRVMKMFGEGINAVSYKKT